MSYSVRPQGRQPTRLPHPWDSPGKNTGVGCHFLLQCRKVKSGSEVAQSYLTLSDPMDCSPPGSSIHGIFQARGLEWGAIAITYSSWSLILFSNLPCHFSRVNESTFSCPKISHMPLYTTMESLSVVSVPCMSRETIRVRTTMCSSLSMQPSD